MPPVPSLTATFDPAARLLPAPGEEERTRNALAPARFGRLTLPRAQWERASALRADPGSGRYRLSAGVEAIGLTELCAELADRADSAPS